MLSKGAEYVLHWATKYPKVTHVVALAPSAYTFAGLDFEKRGSSWTWQRQALPYIDITKSFFDAFLKGIIWPSLTKNIVSYRNTYKTAVEMDEQAEKKRIPIENSQAHICLLAGEDDQVWDRATMAKLLHQQVPQKSELHIYPHAGHIFAGDGFLNLKNMRMSTGGETITNQAAGKKSHTVILSFLARHHQ